MGQLGLDIKQIVAQVLNFILFFLIFKKFIASPFANFLNQEQRKEKEAQDILTKLKQDEESLLQKQVRLKQEMKKEMDKALKEAKKEAELIKNQLITEAKKEADEIKKRAKIQLEDEREKLDRSVKEKLVDLSVAIVNRAFKEYLDDETKKKITQYILANLTKDIIYYEN